MRPVWLLAVLAGCSSSSTTEALLVVAPSAAEQSLATTPWPSNLFLDQNGNVALGSLPTIGADLTPHLLDDLHQIQDGFGDEGGGQSRPILGWPARTGTACVQQSSQGHQGDHCTIALS